MAVKMDILAPQLEAGSSALVLSRWLKHIGQAVVENEPIAELIGTQSRAYVHAPARGTLSAIDVQPGQNILSGQVMGHMSAIRSDSIDWDNFDEVTETIEEFAEKSKDVKQLKDANEALGQLLGITDNPVFGEMGIEQQNIFLQSVIDESKAAGMNPAAMTQRLLEGLYLRMPANAPRGPTGPSFGLQGPSPGGMGGGMGGGYMPPQQHQMAPQPHAYPSYPAYPQMPPHGYPQQGLPPQYGAPPVFPPTFPPTYPQPAFDPYTGQPLAPPPVMMPPAPPHIIPPADSGHPSGDDEKDKQ